MEKKKLWEILDNTESHDEIKFVIGDKLDFDWAIEKINKYNLIRKHTVLLSPIHGQLDPQNLAKWILESGKEMRLQLQAHKYIWKPDTRGV